MWRDGLPVSECRVHDEERGMEGQERACCFLSCEGMFFF